MKLFQIGNRLVSAPNKTEALIRSGLPPYYVVMAKRNNGVHEADGPLFRPGFYSGCTRDRFKRLGVHAAINVRSGEFWRNDHNDRDAKIDRRNARRALNNIGDYRF